MVVISEKLQKILTWIGVVMALVGAIIALAGIAGYANDVKNYSFITIFASGFLIWMLFNMFISASTGILGAVIALVGGIILIILKILELTSKE